MAIKTSTYGGWKLTGEEAQTFLKQIKNSRPNERAMAALNRGQNLLKEKLEKGYVVVKPKKIKSR